MAFRPKKGLTVMPRHVSASEAAAAGVSGGFKPTPRDIGDLFGNVASGRINTVAALEDALRQTGAKRVTDVVVSMAGGQPYARITVAGAKGTSPVTYNSPVTGNLDAVRAVLFYLKASYTG